MNKLMFTELEGSIDSQPTIELDDTIELFLLHHTKFLSFSNEHKSSDRVKTLMQFKFTEIICDQS